MASEPPSEQRRLKLPALHPVDIGESLGQPGTSTRFCVQSGPHPPPTAAKILTKRPSTATLAHTSGPLLPSHRPIATSNSSENLSETGKELTVPVEPNSTPVRPCKPSKPYSNSKSFARPSNTRKPVQTPTTEPSHPCPITQREHAKSNECECLDWASFVQAYAAGNWDPRHTPNPPRCGDPGNLLQHAAMAWDNSLKPPTFSSSASSRFNDTTISRKRVPGTSSTSSVGSNTSLGPLCNGSDRSAGSASTGASSVTSAHIVSPSVSASVLCTPTMPLKLRREKVQPSADSVVASTPSPSSSDLMMALPPMRGALGRSLSDSSSIVPPVPIEDSSRLVVQEPIHDFHAAAATMRLAGDGIDVWPLALPSPEMELIDPLRGHATSLPAPWSREQSDQQWNPTTSVLNALEHDGSQRKKRLNSFWEGLGDISEGSTGISSIGSANTEFQVVSDEQTSCQTDVPIVYTSPLATPSDEAQLEQVRHDENMSNLSPSMPEDSRVTSTVSLQEFPIELSNDYFDRPIAQQQDAALSPPPAVDPTVTRPLASTKNQTQENFVDFSPSYSVDSHVVEDSPATTLPLAVTSRPSAFQRTVSAPIVHFSQVAQSPDQSFEHENRPKSEIFRARKIREEVEYSLRGYLVPPKPPNERERQKALYKFNIVHTAKDANFDRIALLAKLVFNAKICLISLIDADEQWFKSEFGLGRELSPRDESLCGHTILQDSHEPLVVLDTTRDWRFDKNPFVVSHPHTRFYAGAPLRTAEGFNIGSLCIIDSEPRSEFGPRQRHTLKEFAAIVMRELELWRDKIQLRIRDRIQTSMEQFTRECLEIDTQAQNGDPRLLLSSASMEKIYDRAAQLVKRTLDVEGAVLIDVSSFEGYDTQTNDGPMSVLLYHSDPKQGSQSKPLTAAGFAQMARFFKDFPDGKVSDVVLPACIRDLMPGNIHYALTVPIFNIDKRPFAMLCAYNTNAKSKPYLEGHEMSYLRAIGVIILSAVLKRRMILADKSKSLFISNISHELRTPLHGILAAAELLSTTDLSPNQAAFLNTVQACGTSLVETVNHVLDFTKLSGSTKAGGAENNIRPARVDMAQLVEEATEGCWIGHRARHSSEIGSVYSPRQEDVGPQAIRPQMHVETVVDIEHRHKGWIVICEKGGIRRCLMNLLGNALKFTTDGYVHVTLRQLQPSARAAEGRIKLELGVLDSGKGISEEFLKNQLFQPFSQENPLQPGTGLGLAIVNSIVRSESVGGKIDVWSAEHFGTEIRIIFEVQAALSEHPDGHDDLGDWGKEEPPAVTLLGFSNSRGDKLLRQVMAGYLREWWNFVCPTPEDQLGDILVLNEDVEYLEALAQQNRPHRPLILLSYARGDPRVMNAVDAYEQAGGFSRVLFKPIGPNALRQVMKICVRVLRVGFSAQPRAPSNRNSMSSIPEYATSENGSYAGRDAPGPVIRRWSEGGNVDSLSTLRPTMPERSRTSHLIIGSGLSKLSSSEDASKERQNIPAGPIPTISVGTGGLLLKSSVRSMKFGRPIQVLVVEDNNILRELLVKWLRSRGYTVYEAADGQTGVDIFKADAFDVVLLDMSMPILDGVGAATEIRRLERERHILRMDQFPVEGDHPPRLSRLIALTGMSSLEDKRRAFEAGVDGYLVKPVSFKTLQSMFQQLEIT